MLSANLILIRLVFRLGLRKGNLSCFSPRVHFYFSHLHICWLRASTWQSMRHTRPRGSRFFNDDMHFATSIAAVKCSCCICMLVRNIFKPKLLVLLLSGCNYFPYYSLLLVTLLVSLFLVAFVFFLQGNCIFYYHVILLIIPSVLKHKVPTYFNIFS